MSGRALTANEVLDRHVVLDIEWRPDRGPCSTSRPARSPNARLRPAIAWRCGPAPHLNPLKIAPWTTQSTRPANPPDGHWPEGREPPGRPRAGRWHPANPAFHLSEPHRWPIDAVRRGRVTATMGHRCCGNNNDGPPLRFPGPAQPHRWPIDAVAARCCCGLGLLRPRATAARCCCGPGLLRPVAAAALSCCGRRLRPGATAARGCCRPLLLLPGRLRPVAGPVATAARGYCGPGPLPPGAAAAPGWREVRG